MKRLLAIAAVAGLGVSAQTALAVGTAAGTTINNKATVSYSVGSNAQPVIESSPTGNSTPGANNGTNTQFIVDDRIDLTVTRVDSAPVDANPGQSNVIARFTVANTGNAPHAFALSVANLTGGTVFGNTDNTDASSFQVFVDRNGNGTYESGAGNDDQPNIDTLAADAPAVTVFVLANFPNTVTNGQFASVRLIASAAVNNTPGTLVTQTPATTADTALGTPDIVFADAQGTAGEGVRDGKHSADNQYRIVSASLTVTKTRLVVEDPITGVYNNTPGSENFPKAIPGAFVEYTVTVANTGNAAATAVQIADDLTQIANTAFRASPYTGGANVRITINNVNTFCTAEAGGTDTNSDGCVRTAGGVLQVGGAAIPTIPNSGPNSTVAVSFQVSIN